MSKGTRRLKIHWTASWTAARPGRRKKYSPKGLQRTAQTSPGGVVPADGLGGHPHPPVLHRHGHVPAVSPPTEALGAQDPGALELLRVGWYLHSAPVSHAGQVLGEDEPGGPSVGVQGDWG